MVIALSVVLLAYVGLFVVVCACRAGHVEDVTRGFAHDPGPWDAVRPPDAGPAPRLVEHGYPGGVDGAAVRPRSSASRTTSASRGAVRS